MNFIVDKAKALKKWSKVLEHLNVVDNEKRTWMAEYAEMHQLNENVGYNTLGNTFGMGSVTSPQVGSTPGAVHGAGSGDAGSGDVAQNLLPVSMKIAAQTIGLDLVAVKPASSPRLELLFVDFKYDNNPGPHGGANDEHPMVFKISADATTQTQLIADFKVHITSMNAVETIGGVDKQSFVTVNGGDASETAPTGSKAGWLEFLGFSRIDGLPMYRAFRQANNAAAGGYMFDVTKNTFGVNDVINDVLNLNGVSHFSGDTTHYGITLLTGATIQLISTMEDHLPGFSAGWNLNSPMDRLQDEETYPGVIGPDVFTKSVAVGDIEISSQLKRTQIEDIKASTGMDIVQKLESVLINELTQTISKQIVDKIRVLAAENKASNTVPTNFDFDVDNYLQGAGPAPGGETYHSVQRKLVAKINNASNFIATDGRVGPAQYLVTNGNLASVLQDVAGYTYG